MNDEFIRRLAHLISEDVDDVFLEGDEQFRRLERASQYGGEDGRRLLRMRQRRGEQIYDADMVLAAYSRLVGSTPQAFNTNTASDVQRYVQYMGNRENIILTLVRQLINELVDPKVANRVAHMVAEVWELLEYGYGKLVYYSQPSPDANDQELADWYELANSPAEGQHYLDRQIARAAPYLRRINHLLGKVGQSQQDQAAQNYMVYAIPRGSEHEHIDEELVPVFVQSVRRLDREFIYHNVESFRVEPVGSEGNENLPYQLIPLDGPMTQQAADERLIRYQSVLSTMSRQFAQENRTRNRRHNEAARRRRAREEGGNDVPE
jgi:hypothetical protein